MECKQQISLYRWTESALSTDSVRDSSLAVCARGDNDGGNVESGSDCSCPVHRMVHHAASFRGFNLLGHERGGDGETSLRLARGGVRDYDGLAGRIYWSPLPCCPRPRLRETLRFLGPLHHNIPRRLPWTKYSSPALLDAAQNSCNNCLDNAARSTFPRVRLDQLLRAGWTTLLTLAIVN